MFAILEDRSGNCGHIAAVSARRPYHKTHHSTPKFAKSDTKRIICGRIPNSLRPTVALSRLFVRKGTILAFRAGSLAAATLRGSSGSAARLAKSCLTWPTRSIKSHIELDKVNL